MVSALPTSATVLPIPAMTPFWSVSISLIAFALRVGDQGVRDTAAFILAVASSIFPFASLQLGLAWIEDARVSPTRLSSVMMAVVRLRSEERRVGNECGRQWCYRWSA